MHMMRRLKSLTSGRASISGSGGTSRSKRSKVDEDNQGEATVSAHGIKDKTTELDQQSGFTRIKSDNTYESSSVSDPSLRVQDATTDQLPKEMQDMTIKEVQVSHHNEKANSGTVIHGNGIVTHQIITATVGGQDDQPKQVFSYAAEHVAGTGAFGTVFKAVCVETGEAVAIKKVLQDRRYKNRELQIMQQLHHPNVVHLRHHLFSTTEKDELYLNLVLEYVPETVYHVIKDYRGMNQHIPLIYVQLYTYQICRALAYIHNVGEFCHRDIKPQNILVNTQTHQVKLCDFGSAKKLIPGEPNISYICSRYYRAPELIFGATKYTTAIDMWSAGCVFAEFLVGQPLFPGESGVDQIVAIIKILGTPTREEIKCMNPSYNEYQFPQIKAHSLQKLFSKLMPPEGVDLLSKLLQYSPKRRCSALEACAHPFFDCLRVPNLRLPNGCQPPCLFDFTPQELAGASPELIQRLFPAHMKR